MKSMVSNTKAFHDLDDVSQQEWLNEMKKGATTT